MKQLQVVNDKQLDVVLLPHSASTGTELKDGETGRVVNVQGGLGQPAGSLMDTRKISRVSIPSCISWLLIRASELIILMTSDSEDISRLNTPTGSCRFSATCSTMFIASEVLPIDGRAATTIISPGCRPVVILSRFSNRSPPRLWSPCF